MRPGARRALFGGVFLFVYAPILVVAVYSFNDSRFALAWQGFTLRWYKSLLASPEFRAALESRDQLVERVPWYRPGLREIVRRNPWARDGSACRISWHQRCGSSRPHPRVPSSATHLPLQTHEVP